MLLPEPAVVRGLPFWGPAGHRNSTFEGTTRECMYGCPTIKQKGGCARLKRYIWGCVRWVALLVDNQRMFVRVGSHRQSMLRERQSFDDQCEGARFCCRAVRRGASGTTLTLWDFTIVLGCLVPGGCPPRIRTTNSIGRVVYPERSTTTICLKFLWRLVAVVKKKKSCYFGPLSVERLRLLPTPPLHAC